MAVPNRVYAATASKGIYRCAAFTASGDQPVWAAYNAGLAATTPTAFCLDRSASPWDARMYCIQGGDLYRRVAGGDWTVVLTAAAAIALTQAGQQMMSVITDPVTGYVYVLLTILGATANVCVLRSVDSGDNWTAVLNGESWFRYNISNIDAYDSVVTFAYVRSIALSENVWYSVNDGINWAKASLEHIGTLPGDHVQIHPASGIIYGTRFRTSSFDVFRLDPVTGTATYPAGGNGAGPRGGSLWCDPDDADHGITFTERFRETSDDWATLATDQDMDNNYTEIARGCEADCWVHGRVNNGAAVAVSTNGYTLSHRSGANYASSPYADSIPTDCGGIIECGLWAVIDSPTAGPVPPGTIITVGGTPIVLSGPGLYQAVSMPGYTGINRGVPMAGDRGAWDETGYGDLHARDISESTFIHHMDPLNPKVSKEEFDEHVAEANPHETALDDLSDVDTAGATNGQAILYDSLSDTWLPGSITPVSHIHVFQEDHSASCDGAEDTFTTTNYFVIGTTMVWLNGLLQQPGAGKDYVESALGESITFTTAPLTDDILIIAYIKTGGHVPAGPYTGLAGTEIVVLIQTHCHTNESDGDYTPAETVAYYAAAGYDALAITDHDLVTAQPAGIDTAIDGNELSPSTAHIISLNSDYTRGSVTDEQTLVDAVVADGGQAIIAHPNWYIGMTYAQLATLTNYLGIEIHNAHCVDGAGSFSPVTYPGFAVALWDSLLTDVTRGVWGFSVDDFHAIDSLNGYDIGRIRAFVSSNTLENVMAALEAGDFVADASNDGVTPGIPTITGSGVSVSCSGATAIRFIGDSGALLQEDTGEDGEYTFAGTETYVRIEAVGDYTEAFGSAIDTTNRWGVVDGSWSVGSGVLTQATNAAGPYDLVLKKHAFGDLDIKVDFNCATASTENGVQAGICWNLLDTSHRYLVTVAPNVDTIEALKDVGAGWVSIEQASVATDRNTWYTLRVVYVASTGSIRARIWAQGGAEPETWDIDATDTALAVGGAFGLRCRYTASFDNLYINGFKTYYQPIPVGDWE